MLCAILALLILAGCNNTGTSHHSQNICYLDLVAIAKALGRLEVMKQQQDTALQQLNTQLQAISTDFNKQIEETKSKFGDNPRKEELQQLDSLTVNAGKQLQQSQIVAKQKLALYQQQLVAGFQAEVRAHAQSIAEQRGASSVVILDSSVLWFSPSADITDEVIARMRAKDRITKTTSPEIRPGMAESGDSSSEIRRLDDLVNRISEESSAD